MQVTDPRARRVAPDLKAEHSTYPQDAARLKRNELEPEVTAPQMRFGKNSTVRRIVEHINNTYEIG